MHIEMVEVKTFRRNLTCARTGCSGRYQFSGNTTVMSAQQSGKEHGAAVFQHKCGVCGDEQYFVEKFPNLHFEEIPVKSEENTDAEKQPTNVGANETALG